MVQDIANGKAEREASERQLDRSLDRSNPTYTNLCYLSTAFLDLLHVIMRAACPSLAKVWTQGVRTATRDCALDILMFVSETYKFIKHDVKFLQTNPLTSF
jgi:hypothetical protein